MIETKAKVSIPRVVFSRLPDIHRAADVAKHGFESYGRFALLNDNSFWLGDSLSSHPRDTKTGWYWAIAAKTREVIVSARGCKLDLEVLMTPNNAVIARLIGELMRRRII